MTLTPFLIPPGNVATVWPDVEAWLAAALDTACGEINVSQLRLMLLNGSAKLILCRDADGVPQAALAAEFIDYPNYRVGNIIAAGGRGILGSEEGFAQLKGWLKAQGCSYVQASCKEPQMRLWRKIGMETTYFVVRGRL